MDHIPQFWRLLRFPLDLFVDDGVHIDWGGVVEEGEGYWWYCWFGVVRHWKPIGRIMPRCRDCVFGNGVRRLREVVVVVEGYVVVVVGGVWDGVEG